MADEDDKPKKPGMLRRAVGKTLGAALGPGALSEAIERSVTGESPRKGTKAYDESERRAKAGVVRRVSATVVGAALHDTGVIGRAAVNKILGGNRIPGVNGKKAAAEGRASDPKEVQEVATKIADDINSLRSDMEMGLTYLYKEIDKTARAVDQLRRDMRRTDPNASTKRLNQQLRDAKGRYAPNNYTKDQYFKDTNAPMVSGMSFADLLKAYAGGAGGGLAGGAAIRSLLSRGAYKVGWGAGAAVRGIGTALAGSELGPLALGVASYPFTKDAANPGAGESRARRGQDMRNTYRNQFNEDRQRLGLPAVGTKPEDPAPPTTDTNDKPTPVKPSAKPADRPTPDLVGELVVDTKKDISWTTTSDIKMKASSISFDANRISLKANEILINNKTLEQLIGANKMAAVGGGNQAPTNTASTGPSGSPGTGYSGGSSGGRTARVGSPTSGGSYSMDPTARVSGSSAPSVAPTASGSRPYGGGSGPSASGSGGPGITPPAAGALPPKPQKGTEFKAGEERLYHSQGHVQGMNPKLLHMMRDASKDLPAGYHAELISGRDARTTGTTNHPNGLAGDIQIFDDKGKMVPYDRGGPGMKYYEQYHQSMVERAKVAYPNEKFIWGGTWIGAASGHGDPMHMQIDNPNIRSSSHSSGAYNDDRGAHGHEFEPYLMSDKERTEYKSGIRDKIAAGGDYKNSPTNTASSPASRVSADSSSSPHSAALAEERAAVFEHLDKNPALKEKMFAVATNEQSMHPQGVQGVMEETINRAIVRGGGVEGGIKRLERETRFTTEGGYYEDSNGSAARARARAADPANQKFFNEAYEKVRDGSNVSNNAYGNASGGTAQNKITGAGGLTATPTQQINGETFFGPNSDEPGNIKNYNERNQRLAQRTAELQRQQGDATPTNTASTGPSKAQGVDWSNSYGEVRVPGKPSEFKLDPNGQATSFFEDDKKSLGSFSSNMARSRLPEAFGKNWDKLPQSVKDHVANAKNIDVSKLAPYSHLMTPEAKQQMKGYGIGFTDPVPDSFKRVPIPNVPDAPAGINQDPTAKPIGAPATAKPDATPTSTASTASKSDFAKAADGLANRVDQPAVPIKTDNTGAAPVTAVAGGDAKPATTAPVDMGKELGTGDLDKADADLVSKVPTPPEALSEPRSGEDVTNDVKNSKSDSPAESESPPPDNPTGDGGGPQSRGDSSGPGSLRAPVNNPESEGPSPGSDGYGDQCANPDGGGLCAV